jgi:NAD+ diphosphatase
MSDKFLSSLAPSELPVPEAWWFIFSDHRLFVITSGDNLAIPVAKDLAEFGFAVVDPLYIGTFQGRACYAVAPDANAQICAEAGFEDLRMLFGRIDDGLYETALTAVHLHEWDKNCRFCSACSSAMKPRTDVRAKECTQCGRLEFPRISPAIIVLIEKAGTILLARSPRFKDAFFSILAGFVEPGESLEEAVRREVMEEAGITVKNIRYFGSQPWPFPDSLMIGFTAEYDSGEIRIDHEEIVEADWYTADNLPKIPGKLSIAGQMIDWFVEKNK